MSEYLHQCNLWYSTFENPEKIESLEKWKESRNTLIGVIDYLVNTVNIDDMNHQKMVDNMKDSLITADILVKESLKNNVPVILSRLGTTAVE